MAYGARDMRKTDRDMIKRFIEEAPRYPTLLMREPARNIEHFKGWWFGGLAAGTVLEALSCVEGTATNLYGDTIDGVQAIATEMLRRAHTLPGKGGAHQILGSEKVINWYWDAFKSIKRQIIFDRKRTLMGATKAGEALKDASVEIATPADLKLVYEFTGEHQVERWGVDPRKFSPTAHQESCIATIQAGRQLIARDKGKPVFVADITRPDEDTAILGRIFVPRPFRVRKKMVGSILVSAQNLALQSAKEVLCFADQDDELLHSAAEMAGFQPRHGYRLIVMRS